MKNSLRLQNHEFIIFLPEAYKSIALSDNWTGVPVYYRHYSFREQVYLAREINKYTPDLVHFLHFNVPLLYNRPYLVTVHDMLMHNRVGKEATTLPSYMYHLKRMGYKKVFSHAVTSAKHVIVPTNTVKGELMQSFSLLESKFSVIYEGVDAFQKMKIKKEELLRKYELTEPYFFYAGNAYPHKNVGRMIEAIKFLNECSKKHALLAITTPRNVFSSRLEALIRDSFATDYVRLLPFVSDEEMGVLLQHSESFIFASLSEGFGLPGLEAMKMGTMVAASDIPVFHEVYQEHAMYFNPFDFSSIAKSMEDMLSLKSESRKEKIINAKKFVEKYSWKKTAEQTLEIYNSFE